jgi:allophanate hydrolase
MSSARFRIRFAGPHVTLQDGGRPGFLRYGVPCSGAMDRIALCAANIAVRRAPNAPTIEISRGSLQLDCIAGEICVGLAGGGFVVDLNGTKSGGWQVLHIRAGDRLSISPGPWGSWTYLAFAGDFQPTRWLNAAATHAISGFGGGKLLTGNEFSIDAAQTLPPMVLPCPVWARPNPQPHVTIGPQDRFFPAEHLRTLTEQTFHLTDAYDRMGVRLRGPAMPPEGALSIPSEPILRGAVQVSGDGVATVLLADHQTTGGYPKIATMLDHDTDAFAQLRPGDRLRFQTVTPDQALALARLAHQMRADYLQRLARRTQAR